MGKLQITPLKFRGDWILHPEVSKFGFYRLKFGDAWIFHPNVLKLDFTPYVLEVFRFYSLKF